MHKPAEVDWIAVRTEYCTGKTSTRKLAEKYGVSKSLIAKKAKVEGWTVDRGQFVDTAWAKTMDRITDEKADSMVQAVRISRTYMDWLERWMAEAQEDDRPRKSIDMVNIANAMNIAAKTMMMVERRPNIQEQTALDKLRLDQKRFEAEQAAKEAENSDDGVKIIVEVPEGLVIDE